MPYQVTIQTGLKDVMLPNGLRAQGGDVVTLADDEFAMLSASARDHSSSTVFSSIVNPPVINSENMSSQGLPMLSGWTETQNPLVERYHTWGTTAGDTTPLSTPTNPTFLEIG